LILSGELLASSEVLDELKRKDDELSEWAVQAHVRPMFVDIDDPTQQAVAAILGRWPKLVGAAKGRDAADPWVIALAQCQNPPLTVVTGEQGGSDRKPKIDHVARSLGLRVIDITELIVEQGWRLGRA
jgi:hypothetical protein